jgi:hypothetical protein
MYRHGVTCISSKQRGGIRPDVTIFGPAGLGFSAPREDFQVHSPCRWTCGCTQAKLFCESGPDGSYHPEVWWLDIVYHGVR